MNTATLQLLTDAIAFARRKQSQTGIDPRALYWAERLERAAGELLIAEAVEQPEPVAAGE